MTERYNRFVILVRDVSPPLDRETVFKAICGLVDDEAEIEILATDYHASEEPIDVGPRARHDSARQEDRMMPKMPSDLRAQEKRREAARFVRENPHLLSADERPAPPRRRKPKA